MDGFFGGMFDVNGDGALNASERMMDLALTYHAAEECGSDAERLAQAGIDAYEFDLADPAARRKLLKDAGLDPRDFDLTDGGLYDDPDDGPGDEFDVDWEDKFDEEWEREHGDEWGRDSDDDEFDDDSEEDEPDPFEEGEIDYPSTSYLDLTLDDPAY